MAKDDRLDIGSRREVNVLALGGGDLWIPGTVVDFYDPEPGERSGGVAFDLDYPDPRGTQRGYTVSLGRFCPVRIRPISKEAGAGEGAGAGTPVSVGPTCPRE